MAARVRGGEALFRFLAASKRSVVGSWDDEEVASLVASADLVVESDGPGGLDRTAWRERHPGLVWLSISPYGLEGPYAERPVSELTIQAECGSISPQRSPAATPAERSPAARSSIRLTSSA